MKVYSCLLSMAIFLIAGFVLASQPTATTTSAPTSQQGMSAEYVTATNPAMAAEIEKLVVRYVNANTEELLNQFEKYGRAATPFLLEYLQDADPVVQSVIAVALGRTGDPAAYAPLRTILFGNNTSEEIFWPRQAAMRAMVQIDNKNSFDDIAKVLKEDASVQNQLIAVGLLCKYYPEKSVDLCLDVLKTSNIFLKDFTIIYMSAIDDPRVVDAILKASNSQEMRLRASAAVAMFRCKGEKILPRLIELLEDDSYIVSIKASHSIATRGDTSAIAALKKYAAGEIDDRCRMAAMGAILTLKDESVLNDLIAGLKSPLPEARSEAAGGLGSARGTAAIKPLMEIAKNDKDSMVKWSAMSALSGMEPTEELYDFFIPLLASENVSDCQAACQFFSRFDDARTLKLLNDARRNDFCNSLATQAIETIQKRIAAAAASKPTTISVPAN